MKDLKDCECKNWACEDVNIVNLSGHHPRCPKYREIVFWRCEESRQSKGIGHRSHIRLGHLCPYENLIHTEIDDAVYDYLSMGGYTPETLGVYGYARMKMPTLERLANGILERTLEDLDCIDELGSPDGATKPNQEMKAASTVFAEAILRDYVPWACEHVHTVTINVRDWMKDNRPDWLDEIEQ